MSIRKIGFDLAALEGKVVEETDEYLVMPAVIAREIVQAYPSGKAYKPAEELEKAAWTADGRWVTTMKHPDTGLLVKSRDIKGRVESPRFAKDLLDAKTKRPMVRGIRANIKWFKNKVDAALLADIKAGTLRDVSIGFTYDEDLTAGEWEGQAYDFVQRNIFIDHVAAPVEAGRCASPFCGIGVDSIMSGEDLKVAGDPEENEETIRVPVGPECEVTATITISEEKGIKALYCGKVKKVRTFLFSKAKDWTMEAAKAWVKEHKEKGDVEGDMSLSDIKKKIEELKEQREAIRKKLDELYKPKETQEPETKKLYEQLEELDNELRAWQEAKVQAIIKQAGEDCLICNEIEQLGSLAFVKRMFAVYGLNAYDVLTDEEEGKKEKAKAAQKALDEKKQTHKTEEEKKEKDALPLRDTKEITDETKELLAFDRKRLTKTILI